jgi:L-fuconolactonase
VIIDSQVHIWEPESVSRPWPAGGAARAREHIRNPLGPTELLKEMEDAGVDRAILVPPSFEGDRNDVVLAAAREFPARFAVMGRLPVDRRKEAEAILDTWRALPGAFGFRFTFSAGFNASRGISGSWLTDGTCDWVWQTATERSLPVMLHCPGQPQAVRDIAMRYPDLHIAIDHFGATPGTKGPDVVESAREICRLADLGNVCVKASAGPCYSREAYPFRDIQSCLRMLCEAFGASRVFWGSDLSRLPCSYRESLSYITDECGFLTASERRLVLGEAIQGWLGWP